MPTIQSADLWRESGRYDAYGKEMLRISDRHEREMLFGPTNEEMITEIFRAYVRSYKDLPLNLYHIQWKFRDEVRPRFGVMRSREFLMKDAYSFDLTAEAGRHAYNKMFVAYLRTFARMGLTAIPMAAESGPIGGSLSHEFIILAETGESEVFCHKDFLAFPPPPAGVDFDDAPGLEAIVGKWTSRYAATSEMHDAAAYAALPDADKVSARGIEVGHIFYFGTKYSEPMKAVVSGPDGKEVVVQMGSYGIGPSRLVAALIEAGHDAAGSSGPRASRPFMSAWQISRLATAGPARSAGNSSHSSKPPGSTCCTTTATSGRSRNSPRSTSSACPGRFSSGPRDLPKAGSRSSVAGTARANSSRPPTPSPASWAPSSRRSHERHPIRRSDGERRQSLFSR